MALKDCCAAEAARTLRKHRDIAVCDGCGNLLLAYGDQNTYELTVDELDSKDVAYETGRHKALWIVSKER